MAKDFNGGISEGPFSLLIESLKAHHGLLGDLLIALLQEEHTSSQVDPAALRANVALCNAIKAQRLAVETAIGAGNPGELTVKIQGMSRNFLHLTSLVVALDQSLKLVADHTHNPLNC